MCWVTRMPGALWGRTLRIRSTATVPPVEAPMATTWLVVRVSALAGLGGSTEASGWVRMPEAATSFTFWTRSAVMSPTE